MNGPQRDQERPVKYGESVRVSAAVHRKLLTIQYARRMAGKAASLSDIIDEGLQALERAS